jgi:hypothetical protein
VTFPLDTPWKLRQWIDRRPGRSVEADAAMARRSALAASAWGTTIVAVDATNSISEAAR